MNFGMNWGFLGLIGIIVLILIYVIKPNYGQKHVSSTFVWKLSFKYRKKKLPISRFRNIIIIICQILVITMAAFLLAQPFIGGALGEADNQSIVIIDASASMLAYQKNESTEQYDATRFDNALAMIKADGDKAIDSGKTITLIYAGWEAEVIDEVINSKAKLSEALEGLTCTQGIADIEGAMQLATNAINKDHASAEVLLYTATRFENAGNVIIKDISKNEWNAAILDFDVQLVENYYVFTAEVASYNGSLALDVFLEITGANGDATGKSETKSKPLVLVDGMPQTITFSVEDNLRIYSYTSARVYFDKVDSFGEDNQCFAYGGRKEQIRVLYTTPVPSPFYSGVMYTIQEMMKTRWDILLDVDFLGNIDQPIGYDFYIFEYQVPDVMPTDGIVLIACPDRLPPDFGLTLGERVNRVDELADGVDSLRLSDGEYSEVMKYVNPYNMFISEYTRVDAHQPEFVPIMNLGDDPVFFIKNADKTKIALHTFSFRFSNLAIAMDFPILIYSLFDYFLPATIDTNLYDVDTALDFGQTEAVLKEGGAHLEINGGGGTAFLDGTIPYQFVPTATGSYNIIQTLLSGREIEIFFFVKVARTESDFLKISSFAPPEIPPKKQLDYSLFVYFAAALVGLLFLEKALTAFKEDA